jgi:competence protein ComGF
MKKIKPVHLSAFTILEALFSLLLLSIILSIMYLIVNMLNKQMSLFEKENTQVIEYNFFDRVLNADTHNSIDYSIYENELKLFYYQQSNVRYTLHSEYVIRKKEAKIDTLKVAIKAHSFLFFKEDEATKLTFKIALLDELIVTNYMLRKSPAVLINEKFSNEN